MTNNLVRLLASLVLIVLILALVEGYVRTNPREESEQLALVLIILGVAVFIQAGNEFLKRLKKVGPVEFFAREARPLLKALHELKLEEVQEDKPLSKQAEFKYQQAELLVSNLQFASVEDSELASNRDLHELLLRLGGIAWKKKDWARAIDRLELLIKISGGEYEPRETFLRCIKSYLSLAESFDDKESEDQCRERRRLLWKAHDLSLDVLETRKKRDHKLYAQRGYVQDELGMYPDAIESNNLAIKHRRCYARAKYNKACSQVKSKDLAAAYDTLKEELKEDDLEIRKILDYAEKDPELRPLREDPLYQRKMRALFDSRRDW